MTDAEKAILLSLSTLLSGVAVLIHDPGLRANVFEQAEKALKFVTDRIEEEK